MAPGIAFYQSDKKSMMLALIAILIVIGLVYMISTGQIKIGEVTGVITQPGDAYMIATISFTDYFGDDANLPSTVDVRAFDEDQNAILITTVDLTKTKTISTTLFTVKTIMPRFYIGVDAPISGSTMWYVIYPPEVNKDAPTVVSGYTVYPVDLKSVLGTLEPNKQYSYTMSIVLAKTYNYSTLQLPSVLNISAGFTPSASNPVAVSVGGTLTAPSDEVMFKNMILYVIVPANVTPRSLTFNGVSYSLEKVNDTTYKAVIGDVTFATNETSKSFDIGLDISATGSFTITIKAEDTLPDGTQKILATASTTINVS